MAFHDWFPDINRYGYSVTSPPAPNYNCIAWAANVTTHWWWPPLPGAYTSYWPAGVSADQSIEAFTHAFATLGYVECNSIDVEDGFEKVALYADIQGNTQHAARQLPSGVWTSKLGKSNDIEHHALEAIEGPLYGRVVRILRRVSS